MIEGMRDETTGGAIGGKVSSVEVQAAIQETIGVT
jgi:hypothetical protein